MNRSVLLVILVIAILFGVFVWPSRYRYDRLARGQLIRIDRLTSRVDILYRGSGWTCYSGCPTPHSRQPSVYDDLLTPAKPETVPAPPQRSVYDDLLTPPQPRDNYHFFTPPKP